MLTGFYIDRAFLFTQCNHCVHIVVFVARINMALLYCMTIYINCYTLEEDLHVFQSKHVNKILHLSQELHQTLDYSYLLCTTYSSMLSVISLRKAEQRFGPYAVIAIMHGVPRTPSYNICAETHRHGGVVSVCVFLLAHLTSA